MSATFNSWSASESFTKLALEYPTNHQGPQKAAEALLRDLMSVVTSTANAIANVPGRMSLTTGWENEPDLIYVQAGNITIVYVRYDANRRKLVLLTKDREVGTVPLEYNGAAKRFESLEFDDASAPTPGQPRPRRAAIDVLAQEVVRLIKAARAE